MTSSPAKLLAEIKQALHRAMTTTLRTSGSSQTAGDDLYEAYLFTLVLKAAARRNYTVEYRDSDGNPARILHLRRGPGLIQGHGSRPSPGAPHVPYTHAVLTAAGRPALEVHTGIRVKGISQVRHEADVLILPKAKADLARKSRAGSAGPRSSDPFLILEAKYYTKNVGLAEVRSFIGLSKDVNSDYYAFVSTVAHSSPRHLLAHVKTIDYAVGALPHQSGEAKLVAYLEQILERYQDKL